MDKKIKGLFFKLLRWTEKYTRTDMVYLLKGSFWLSLGQIFSSGSAFILAVAFANLASAETYGTYRFVLSIAAIFSISTLPGMNTALTRSVAKGNIEAIHIATYTRIKFSFIGVVFAFIASIYYFFNTNYELALVLLIIAITLPIFDTFTLYTAYLLGLQRFNTHTKYQIITQFISTTCLLIALFLNTNLSVILLSYFLPLIAVRTFFYFVLTKQIPKVRNALTIETLTYGKHLTWMNLLSAIAAQIDKVLMWTFFGPVELAMYSISLAVPTQIQGLLKRVDVLALPRLSLGKTTISDLLRKWTVFTACTIPLTVLYIALTPFIFDLFFPQYANTVPFSQLLSLIIILTPKTLMRAFIEAKGASKELYFFHTLTSITKILLLSLLIPPFGLYGAVLSILINEVLSLILIFILLKRLSD